jgi:hypothetical protein
VERVERDGNAAFNWAREGLVMNVDRLKQEVPDGVDLDRLVELVFGDLTTPAAAIVDALVIR